MFTQDPALMALSRIRAFLIESSRRRLSVPEIKELAAAMVSLTKSIDADEWARRHIEAIERGVQREFSDRWPSNPERREDVILETYALSGHLLGM